MPLAFTTRYYDMMIFFFGLLILPPISDVIFCVYIIMSTVKFITFNVIVIILITRREVSHLILPMTFLTIRCNSDDW